MSVPSIPDLSDPRLGYVLGLADDALISAQRLSWWVSRAPELEEDVALANIALDQLGQARLLLDYAGRLAEPECGRVLSEDDLAYFRDDRAFRNVHLVERDPGDFAVTMIRLLVFASYCQARYAALTQSTDQTLAAIADKALKEVRYHLAHASGWVIRLGDGTEESAARARAALLQEWPYVEELFDDFGTADLVAAGFAVAPSTLREAVLGEVRRVLREAQLPDPLDAAVADQLRPAVGGGRRGLHTEELGFVLAEMQHLARSHPGADW